MLQSCISDALIKLLYLIRILAVLLAVYSFAAMVNWPALVQVSPQSAASTGILGQPETRVVESGTIPWICQVGLPANGVMVLMSLWQLLGALEVWHGRLLASIL